MNRVKRKLFFVGVKTMSKKKKMVVIIVALFSVLLISIIAHKAYSNIVMKYALADKYSWSIIDIRIKRHTPKETKHNYNLEGGPRVLNYNEKWVCEYKGREFNVELTDDQYADDYQLEDIFNWCTEWLQENVDPEIEGVEIFSDIIYHSSEYKENYKYTLPWDTKKVFTKNDAFDLLSVQRKYESVNGLGVFYKVNDLSVYSSGESFYSNIIKGNNQYYGFCKTKAIDLSKITITKDCIIILTERPVFSSYTGEFSGTSFLRIYSLDANKGFPCVTK